MSQILSTEEIDAMIKGLEDGSIDIQEIEDNIPAGSSSSSSFDDRKISSYIFGQKTAIRVGALPGLDLINEHLASQLSFKLSQKVGREVHIQPKATINQVFGRFLHTLETPIFINILRVEPSQAMALLAIDGDIMYHILEGFFGGSGQSERPFRNFSTFEMKVIDRIMDVTREQIEASWRKLDPSFRLILARWENQPQFAAVMPLDETVFLITFSVEIGESEGSLTICFPAVILELFKQQLKVGFQQKEAIEGESAWRTSLVSQLSKVSLKVVPIVARSSMTVREMFELKEGDVIPFNTDLSAEMDIEVAGMIKFKGVAGVVNGNRAVRVTRAVKEGNGIV